jgi:hypothetical protein
MERSRPDMSLYFKTILSIRVSDMSFLQEIELLTSTSVGHLFSSHNPVTIVAAVANEVEDLACGENLESGVKLMCVDEIVARSNLSTKSFTDKRG